MPSSVMVTLFRGIHNKNTGQQDQKEDTASQAHLNFYSSLFDQVHEKTPRKLRFD